MTQSRPLVEILAEIPDFRKDQGKRHPLSAILALACVAIMCGAKGYLAMSEWGRNYGKEISKALGFTHQKTPCSATFCNIFRKLDIKLMESKLGEWANNVSSVTGISIDGKTLHGSVKQNSGITHLLNVVGCYMRATRSLRIYAGESSRQNHYGHINSHRYRPCEQ